MIDCPKDKGNNYYLCRVSIDYKWYLSESPILRFDDDTLLDANVQSTINQKYQLQFCNYFIITFDNVI